MTLGEAERQILYAIADEYDLSFSRAICMGIRALPIHDPSKMDALLDAATADGVRGTRPYRSNDDK